MPERLNVGVIGAGRIGQVHAKNLAHHVPSARLAALADVDLEAARRCAGELGVSAVFDDYRHMLDDAGVHAVAVCSSTDAHAEMIEAASAAGKHVFCEKPISLDLSAIDSVLTAVQAAGVKFQIGFNRRFDPSFRRVREGVLNGEIGEPELVHLISRDASPPPIDYVARSGGLFFDMTIHDFDMARFLLGSEVEEIYAQGAVLVDPAIGEAGDLDTAVLTLTFANGAIGTIDNSRRSVYGYDQRAEVFGSKGAIRTSNVYPNSAEISTGSYVGRDLPLHFFVERYADSYREEMRAFVDAVLNDQPVPVTGEDGRAPVVMGLAARKSIDEHRPVGMFEIDPRSSSRR